MVDLQEIARYMRMGRTVPDGALAARVTELREEALKIVRPAHIWRRFPIIDGNLVSGSVRIAIAGTLARHLNGCQSAFLSFQFIVMPAVSCARFRPLKL